MPNDAHVQAMKSVGLDDPEVKAAANRLALKALLHAEQLIDHGSPELKIRIIHSILPSVASMLRAGELDDAVASIKSEFHELFREMTQPKALMKAQEGV